MLERIMEDMAVSKAKLDHLEAAQARQGQQALAAAVAAQEAAQAAQGQQALVAAAAAQEAAQVAQGQQA